ncbi:redoxin domain-containing protein [Swingsia samuiensis]|uniref:Redoxin domain-containing protein n=1 Tax=Swingsia samuiensis TaxID=1293412 RepID=A0A4Y6UKD8_9PROT|nr:redoxin domain-containing protein [Swingsia samuiensis]QDH17260.1 redoxin domain-containing protein [Swingsia samuiensis]
MTPTRRKFLTALPIAGAGVLGVSFWRILHNMNDGSFDPRAVNNPHVGRPIPTFSLPGIIGQGDGFSDHDLRAQTRPVLINFFASWCIPCVQEMPGLRAISRKIPIWGIAYEDKPENADAFIKRDGSPYERLAADRHGKTAIDWGVTGVPESFLIIPGGRIIWHGSAALDPQTFENEVLPRLAKVGL